MRGLITKAYNIWYEVATEEGTIRSRPRGRLRGGDLLVGDRVEIKLCEDGTGRIESVEPRVSQLARPAIANVEQVVLVVSLAQPPLEYEFMDRVILLAAHQGLQTVLVINKIDVMPDGIEKAGRAAEPYRAAGLPVVLASAAQGVGIDELRSRLQGVISVFAGRSGVGKSSLLNALNPGLSLRTGEISPKKGLGRHTTRHVELLRIGDGWVADAPGFSRVDITEIASDELPSLMPEFRGLQCRFRGCFHISEPGCAVRQAVEDGRIDFGRYHRYTAFLKEIKEAETTRW